MSQFNSADDSDRLDDACQQERIIDKFELIVEQRDTAIELCTRAQDRVELLQDQLEEMLDSREHDIQTIREFMDSRSLSFWGKLKYLFG